MRRVTSGGGWPAIRYVLQMARRVGWRRLWRAMRSKNACKTCALGMGGQQGGMRNELGRWPEVCKKSLQAMVADMQHAVPADFFQRCSLADLRARSPRQLEASGRLVHPLYAGPAENHYRLITWDEALDRIAAKLKATSPQRTFFYMSGRSSNEAGFLLQLFARLYGTNHVNNCSYYCHQASGVGLTAALGTGTATVVLEDLEQADLFLLIGGNPASNHPRLMTSLMSIRRRGGQVVVINPVRETGLVNFRVPSDWRSLVFGSPIASLYVQPHIGGDIALLTGIAKLVIERGAVRHDFIEQATEGYADFRQLVADTDWQTIEQASGVERATIEQVANLYLGARNVVFGWTMGITHHEHGVANVQMIVNVALLRGMVGRPHAGLLPIRGHSNVQGIGSVGVTPALKEAVFDRLRDHFGITLPTTPGLDTFGAVQAADAGDLRVGVCLGGNLFGATPDARFAARALAKLDLLVYLNTSLNTGHAWGLGRETLVLPVLARDEDPQKTTQESMFNYVRLSEGGPARYRGPWSEVAVVAEIAQRVLGDGTPVDWRAMRQHANLRAAIAKIVPGYEKIGEIDRTKQEFHVAGRTLRAPRFPTRSGKARFHAHSIPGRPLRENELRLMTVRSEGQFNTVVYEDEDLYRGQERRDVILLNPADIERLGLAVNQRVSVRSETGALPNTLVRAFSIRAGNALMYYPEANVLVPPRIDPASKTPAFKSVTITLEREPELPVIQVPDLAAGSTTEELQGSWQPNRAPVLRPATHRSASSSQRTAQAEEEM